MYDFGEVKSINDPEKLGRVKVSVYGFHDDIPHYQLGWSNVIMPANTPATLGQGHSVNLKAEVLWKTGDLLPEAITKPEEIIPGPAGQSEIIPAKIITDVAPDYGFDAGSSVPRTGDVREQGSLVCGMFLDAAQQEFLVIGTLPTKTDGTQDNNLRARGEVDPHRNEQRGVYEPVSPYAPKYPYNHVYETESGHVKEYDDTPSNERIKERHKSGTQYEIGPNGAKVEKIINDNYQLVAGHDTLEVKGNVKIIISGDANIAVAKNLTAQVGQDMTTIVNGNAYTTVDKNADLLVKGNMTTTVNGNADLLIKGDIDGEVRGSILFDVGEGKPEHVIYDDAGVAVHHHDLTGYTKHQAITQWFPPVKTDTFTLTYRNMRTVKEMSTEAQAPYADALTSFADYDASKVALVDGKWTYPDKTSYIAEYGVIELHTEGKLQAIIGGEADITAMQSAKINVLDNADIDVGGNLDVDVAGNITFDATSDTSTIDITSVGNMTLKSPTITLDGDVNVTEVLQTNTDGTNINLNTHVHTQPDTGIDATSQGNTNGPQNP